MWKATENHHIIFSQEIIMAENTKTMALSPRQTFDGQRVRRIPGSVMKIATWNVRSLYGDGKLENTIREMKRLRLDILGISELRWIGDGVLTCDDDDVVVYYSGSSDTVYHRNGVAIVINKRLRTSVKKFLPISDRVMLLQLQAKPFDINLIQIYAPTAEKKNDDSVEVFYADLEMALKHIKKHEVTLVIGDFNAKIGQGLVADVVGQFGLGERNDRGDRLVQFCQENDFVVSNTYFKLPPRRLYTWQSPAHTSDNIIRNQIDYVLISKRYRNSIVSAKTYPGADIDSDHNPVVAKIQIKVKKVCRPVKTASMDVDKLRDPRVKENLRAAINDVISQVKHAQRERNSNIEQSWQEFKTATVATGRMILQTNPCSKKAKWMTDDILQIMDERRENKGNKERYNKLKNVVRRKIRDAKKQWIEELCSEIEEMDKRYDYFHMHKKVKEMIAPKYRGCVHMTLQHEDSSYASTTAEKLIMWEDYIKQLFHDERQEDVVLYPGVDEGPFISRREISYAIETAKHGKAIGSDEIPVDILKAIDETNLDYLENLFNAIYDTGKIPTDWLQSTFIALPKVKNPKKCSDYRTISLMSHVLKIFLKIIHRRIYAKCENILSKTQFGFRNGLGTREALFGYQVLVQRCWDMDRYLYICFIDYEKAFDRIRHDKLMRILQEIGLDYKDLRFIKNLYWEQNANVRIDGLLSSYIDVIRGVRQGCILSPLLFNLYAEAIFSEALNDISEGISVNGYHLNNIRYADDTILIADSLQGLQRLVDVVSSTSAEYGIDINCKKTKYMVIGRTPEPNTSLFLNGNVLERVNRCRYLGVMVDDTGDHSLEIKCRIEQARSVFSRMRRVLCDRNLGISLRTRVARCYIFSVLLYGVEAWTLTKAMSRRLEAFEMWVYRRMLGISWRDRVRNTTVLQRMRKAPEILNTIQRRKIEYLGHVLRNPKYEILQVIIQGRIEGKRRPGRPRMSWLDNLRQWLNMSTAELFRAVGNKSEIAMMVANLR